MCVLLDVCPQLRRAVHASEEEMVLLVNENYEQFIHISGKLASLQLDMDALQEPLQELRSRAQVRILAFSFRRKRKFGDVEQLPMVQSPSILFCAFMCLCLCVIVCE